MLIRQYTIIMIFLYALIAGICLSKYIGMNMHLAFLEYSEIMLTALIYLYANDFPIFAHY